MHEIVTDRLVHSVNESVRQIFENPGIFTAQENSADTKYSKHIHLHTTLQ